MTKIINPFNKMDHISVVKLLPADKKYIVKGLRNIVEGLSGSEDAESVKNKENNKRLITKIKTE